MPFFFLSIHTSEAVKKKKKNFKLTENRPPMSLSRLVIWLLVLFAGGWWSYSPRTGVCHLSCACRPSAACKKSTMSIWPCKCSGTKALTSRTSTVTVSCLTHTPHKDLARITVDVGFLFFFPGSNIESKDIVDGHREKTLGLLWKILFAFHVRSLLQALQSKHLIFTISFFDLCCRLSTDALLVRYLPQVEVILDESQLIEEICFLKKTLKTKRSLASLRAGQGLHCSSTEARKPYEHNSTKIRLLMDWIRTVSDFYNLKVSVEFQHSLSHNPNPV